MPEYNQVLPIAYKSSLSHCETSLPFCYLKAVWLGSDAARRGDNEMWQWNGLVLDSFTWELVCALSVLLYKEVDGFFFSLLFIYLLKNFHENFF